MRRSARELALQALFQSEFTINIPFPQFLGLFEEKFTNEVLEYAQTLVQGVEAHRESLDQIIAQSSRHWKLDRIALVEKNILRIALFEMKFSNQPVKPNIVIDEAIEIGKKYGSTEAGSFINGILDHAAKS